MCGYKLDESNKKKEYFEACRVTLPAVNCIVSEDFHYFIGEWTLFLNLKVQINLPKQHSR